MFIFEIKLKFGTRAYFTNVHIHTYVYVCTKVGICKFLINYAAIMPIFPYLRRKKNISNVILYSNISKELNLF